MLLKKSICELAAKTNAGHAKLWGKIRGMQKDYYIVEGTVEGGAAGFGTTGGGNVGAGKGASGMAIKGAVGVFCAAPPGKKTYG